MQAESAWAMWPGRAVLGRCLMELKRARIVVHGIVQGVFFRHNTKLQAQELGLSGWVRNCPDGTVEMIAQGNKEDIAKLTVWCYKGPPGAYVTKVDVDWLEDYSDEFHGFRIRY